MSLSRQSLEILLDLIEMKVNAIQIQDKEDARELNKLRKCRQELIFNLNQISSKRRVKAMETGAYSRRRTYRRANLSGY